MEVNTKNKTKRSKQSEERRAAVEALAMQLSNELTLEGEKGGKHTQTLARIASDPLLQGLQRYSPLNQLLINQQFPGATDVAGYVEWQSRGKKVMRGQKGIAIRAPRTAKGEGEGEQVITGFHITYVWDISQVVDIDKEVSEGQSSSSDLQAPNREQQTSPEEVTTTISTTVS